MITKIYMKSYTSHLASTFLCSFHPSLSTLGTFITGETRRTYTIVTFIAYPPRPIHRKLSSTTHTRNKHKRICLKFRNFVANIDNFLQITKYYHLIMIVVGLRNTSQEGILAKTVEINAEAYVPNSPRSWHCCMQPNWQM